MADQTDTFDYIVTGAGSAGCVVAARLSENGRYSVLLLEAGGRDRHPFIHVPMGYAKLYADPRFNWMYESEPEPHLDNRPMFQPRGKVLGGTSSINGMLYMRGNPADYNEWRQTGCVGWDWDSVLPYFKKSEDQERGASEFHGVGGPLRVSNHPIKFELANHWIEAATQAGLPKNDDFNDGQQDGAGHFQCTTNHNRRWSAAAAFLEPARSRKNLKVSTNSFATRILFREGRAVGVVYRRDGVERTAYARSEVIVSGGVFNSPQLLQLSGIGPGALLQQHGIGVVHENGAVGDHLQDHFCFRFQFRCTQPVTLNDVANNFWRRMLAGAQYVLFRKGMLASNGIAAGAFARSDERLDRPDIQLNFTAWSFAGRDAKGVYPHPFPGFSVNAVHLRPDARGYVRLKAPEPEKAPEIRFNFLKTDYDLSAIRTGMRLIRRIAQQPAIAPFVREELLPGAHVKTDAEFETAIRQNGVSNLHPVGTCRMGPNGRTVVDPQLRVHGVERLRVIDASVMPTVPGGNTNAPTIMIAEKGSEMILKDALAQA
ncbi:GMC family oxidoreductase [Bosea sp. (in: a-proteobacteria)]|uniref:GMC family oxidoreductase n=1 Tax=Bosea sp. (in: a-proteobacteria) TaxID=1871050 RepID=UPI00260D1F31|nr:choline dehydrogenase [Bosea sp. (in: a-proteobacteria)]MCO5091848.1 choline dehydrogenase [Bosea sp. (in: a-proteobacteria)]